jgi:hypothetical protein
MVLKRGDTNPTSSSNYPHKILYRVARGFVLFLVISLHLLGECQVVGRDYYNQEADLTSIDRIEVVRDTTVYPFQHMVDP